MKKVLFFFAALLTIAAANAQNKAYTGATNTLTINRGGAAADTIQIIPIRDTVIWMSVWGNLTIRPQDNRLYYRAGGVWRALAQMGSGSGGAIVWSDTISTIATKKNLKDTAQAIRTSLALKEDKTNKVTTWTTWEYDTLHYPSTKWVLENLQANYSPYIDEAFNLSIDSMRITGDTIKRVTLYRKGYPAVPNLVDSFRDNNNTYEADWGLIRNGQFFRIDTMLVYSADHIDSLISSTIYQGVFPIHVNNSNHLISHYGSSITPGQYTKATYDVYGHAQAGGFLEAGDIPVIPQNTVAGLPDSVAALRTGIQTNRQAIIDSAAAVRNTHGLQQTTNVNNTTNRALNTTGATGVNAAGTALAHTPIGGAIMYLGAAKLLMSTGGTTLYGPGTPAMSILPGHTEFNSVVRASPAVAGSDVVIKEQLDSVAAAVQDSISAQDLQAVSEKGDTTTHRLTMNGLTVTDTAGTPATTTAAIQVVRTLGALPFSNARGFADYSIFQRPGASYNSYDAVVTFRGPGIGHYTGNQIRPDFDGASVGDYESYWTWAKLRNGSHVVRRNDIVLGAGEIDGTSTLDTSAAITIENNRIGTVKYALRSYDAAAKTFHAGNFRIGSSADPAFTLQVDGLSRFERIGLGANPYAAAGLNNRLLINGGGYGYLGYHQVSSTISGASGAYYIVEPQSGASTPYIYGVHVDQPDPIAPGASVGDNVAFKVGPGWTMGSTLNAAFSGNIPAGTNNFNLHIPGTARNYLQAATGIGTADPAAKLDVVGNIKQDSIKSGVVVADANGFLIKGVAGVDYMPAGGDSATYVTHPALAAALSDSLSNYAALSLLGANNGIATLGPTGKIPNGQVPAIAISETYPVSSEAAQLALPAEQGDVAVRLDQSKSYILTNNDPSSIANWQELLAPTVANTDQVPEGSTNLYFTVARARQALSGGTGIGFNNSTGVITNTSPNLQSNLSLGTATGTTQPINNSDGTGVTLPAVSGSAAGLMSASDKTKLDGISPGAEVNVNADWSATSGDAEILNKPTSLPPSGSAGGDLSGSFPNPQVVDDSHSHTIATLSGVEPAFTKNTAFNKNFGTAAGTVAEGNDSRIVNGQTAFTWGNHASAGYAQADSSRWQTTYRSDTARANVYTALAGKEPTITTLPVSKGGLGVNTVTGYLKGNGTSPVTGSATIPYSDITGTPTIPTVNNGTLTLNTGGLLTGSASFTANQAGNTTFTVTSPSYGTTSGTIAQGNDSRIINGQTAFGWGDHALAGYLTGETDPNLAAIDTRIVRSRQGYYGNGNGFSIDNASAEHGFVYPDGGAGGIQGPFISAGQFNGSNGYMLQIVGGYDNDGKEFRIRTRNGDLGTWNPLRKIWTDVDFSKSDFIHNQDGAEQSASMRINGTIRVGTGAPATAAISIGGTPAGQGLDLSSNDQYLNGRVFQNTNNPFDNHMYFGYNSGSGSALHFYSDDIETATITDNKVGIGTTSPTAKVNIAYSSGAELKLGESITGNTTLGIGLSAATNGYGIMQAVKADGSALGDIALNPAGGNIGIGTGSPQAKLHVAGSVRINSLAGSGAGVVGVNNDGDLVWEDMPASGEYTPTITPGGSESCTPAGFKYSRIGNIVHVSGRVTISGISGLTGNSFRVSLPYPSDLVNDYDATGHATGKNMTNMDLDAVPADDDVNVSYDTGGTGVTISVSFDYVIN